MAEIFSRHPDCCAHIVFLDIHVEGIQHYFDIGAVHRMDKIKPLAAGVHDVAFKPVENFHPKHNAAILSHFGKPLHIDNCAFGIFFLVHRKRGVERPVGIKPAAENMDIQFLQLGKNHAEKLHGAFHDGRVR